MKQDTEKRLFFATEESPYHVSSGGVVFKYEGETPLICLLHRQVEGEKIWNLPRGSVHDGETLEHCAIREIKEETGFAVSIKGYLGSTSRQSKNGSVDDFQKTTHFFLCGYLNQVGEMDEEHDGLEWVPTLEAIKRLEKSNRKEEEPVMRAAKRIGM